jgi:DNA recombination protein RmuC
MTLLSVIVGLMIGLAVGGSFAWYLNNILREKDKSESVNVMKMKVAKVEAENKVMKGAHQRLLGEMEGLSAELRESRKKEIDMSEDRAFVSESKKSISHVHNELGEAKEKINDLQDVVAALKADNLGFQQARERYEENIAEKERKFSDDKAQLTLQAQKNLHVTEERLAKAFETIDAVHKQIAELKSRNSELELNMKNISGEHASKDERLSRETATSMELRSFVTELKEQLSLANIKINEIETINDDLRQKMNEIHASNQMTIVAAGEKEVSLREELKATAGKLKDTIAKQHLEIEVLQKKITALKEENEDLHKKTLGVKTSQEKQADEVKERLAILEDTREKMYKSFESLFSDALKKNQEAFLGIADQKLSPFQDLLDEFNSHVVELETQRKTAYDGVTEQLRSLSQTQNTLKAETNKIAKALRPPHVGSEWGEMQLEQAIEMAGIGEHCEFTRRKPGDEAVGPDVIIRLPRGGAVAVDAHLPTKAFLDYIEAGTDEEKERELENHVANVRKHIEMLSSDEYSGALDQKPEFVLLFIPTESVYFAALQKAPELIREAADHQVLLAPPTSFIALLKTIAVGWREVLIAENTKKISDLGEELYTRLGMMGSHIDLLGKNLMQSVDAYNKTVGSFEQRVLTSARRFQDLQGKPLAELPEVNEIDLRPRRLKAPEFTLPGGAMGIIPDGHLADEDEFLKGDGLAHG